MDGAELIHELEVFFTRFVQAPASSILAACIWCLWTWCYDLFDIAPLLVQGLNHHGSLDSSQRVLINGGSGGVGTFAVQIARALGPALTVVTSTQNVDMVRSLGANEVIDYTTTDFARGGERYDLILDTVGNRSVADLRGCLTKGGKAAITGFTDMTHMLSTSLRGGKTITQVSAHVSSEDLGQLARLVDGGEVRPVIDRTVPFVEVPEAITYVEQGHARGKVVIDVPYDG